MNKKRSIVLVFLLVAASLTVSSASAKDMGKDMGEGWPYYVDVVVDWDPTEDNFGDWNVYAQEYWVETHPTSNKEVGDQITGCSDCLEMEYDFNIKGNGNILKFNETYVSGVEAHPQTHTVVLHDKNGDGIYTGSITARYDFPSEIGQFTRMDIIEYNVTVVDNNVTYFKYVEKEYKKPIIE